MFHREASVDDDISPSPSPDLATPSPSPDLPYYRRTLSLLYQSLQLADRAEGELLQISRCDFIVNYSIDDSYC